MDFGVGRQGGQGDPGSHPLLLPPSGGFRTGPSPLTAIRQGLIQMKYDTTFVFTEVNGDKFIWLVKQNQEREKNILIAVETASIGKKISTKMVGENRREDITLQYKFPEGSCVITGQFQEQDIILNQDSPWWKADLRPRGADGRNLGHHRPEVPVTTTQPHGL